MIRMICVKKKMVFVKNERQDKKRQWRISKDSMSNVIVLRFWLRKLFVVRSLRLLKYCFI